MATGRYEALVLDIDGTLLDDRGQMSARTEQALARARAAGVVVMLATGRSLPGVRVMAQQLALETPVIAYNGAAVYDPLQDRLVERFALSAEFVDQLVTLCVTRELLMVLGRHDGQYASEPRSEREAHSLAFFRELQHRPAHAFPRGEAIRFTIMSHSHADSDALHEEVRAAVSHAAYYVHYSVAALAGVRDWASHVLDVQPECAGKAEAFRLLAQRFGIPVERVVAVGDGSNDIPMLQGAGLGVAMGNADPVTKRAAHRVIGDHNGDALAELIDELFLDGTRTDRI